MPSKVQKITQIQSPEIDFSEERKKKHESYNLNLDWTHHTRVILREMR